MLDFNPKNVVAKWADSFEVVSAIDLLECDCFTMNPTRPFWFEVESTLYDPDDPDVYVYVMGSSKAKHIPKHQKVYVLRARRDTFARLQQRR